jgi:hypothetical protein
LSSFPGGFIYYDVAQTLTMSRKISVIGAVVALTLAANVQDAQAFAPATSLVKSSPLTLFAEETKPTEAVFMPVEDDTLDAVDTKETKVDEVGLEVAELLGRGSAKVGYHSLFLLLLEI